MSAAANATPEQLVALFAYPSRPAQIGQTIRAAIDATRIAFPKLRVKSWEENDVAGRFLVEPILTEIDAATFVVADITRINFNVVFEIGYAIGRRKRTYLVRNSSLTTSDELVREIGVFDTLGYSEYVQSSDLAEQLRSMDGSAPLIFDDSRINTASPVYAVLPRIKTDAEIRLVSRIKKARLQFRSFDPDEQGRLSAHEAIDQVAQSHGVVIPLVSKERRDADIHNFRAAFVAGLAVALDRALLLLQEGMEPVPLDYRDLVSSYRFPNQIDSYVAEFSTDISARYQATTARVVREPRTFLDRLSLGASSAENELQELGNYYLKTDEYRRVLRGEVRIVTGRKGAGKTALFSQIRDSTRQDKSRIVLDLKPEGFQLIKLRERVLDFLEEGTKEHTITAFWEYLLLLETCHKILEKDKTLHMHDHHLFKPYRQLAEAYYEDDRVTEGDFSERMLLLMQRIADDFDERNFDKEVPLRLVSGQITELLHKHDVATLRDRVIEYMTLKKGLWILFDNLDKGWPAHGVGADDVLTLRSLLSAMAKVEHWLQRRNVECHGVVFIRNDVYELLIDNSPDRGKIASVILDWTDPDLLRELLRRRFLFSGIEGNPSFDAIWRDVATTHINGEETSQYLIDRSLMRPRALIELLRYCRSHAVNLDHHRIEAADIEHGEEAYSSDVLNNINFEIRDIAPQAGDVLYEFVESPSRLTGAAIKERMVTLNDVKHWQRLLDLLLWYGFIGVVRDGEMVTYIYSVKYDMKRLKALVSGRGIESTLFQINPAFWRALEVKQEDK
jgi:hypothetical protein